LLLHDKFFLYIILNHQKPQMPLLTYQFNGYPIAELKLNCKKLLLLRLAKRAFIENKKKEIVAFHLNNNLLSTAGW
jgi:hypothetical protein